MRSGRPRRSGAPTSAAADSALDLPPARNPAPAKAPARGPAPGLVSEVGRAWEEGDEALSDCGDFCGGGGFAANARKLASKPTVKLTAAVAVAIAAFERLASERASSTGERRAPLSKGGSASFWPGAWGDIGAAGLEERGEIGGLPGIRRVRSNSAPKSVKRQRDTRAYVLLLFKMVSRFYLASGP